MENKDREKVLPNGDIYVGNFEGLLPHGMGRYIWLDGTVYEGEWAEGKMTGRGRISWSSGATYEGDFSGGYLHGSGTFTGLDGSIYEGTWRMNIQHGMGQKTFCNSDIYEGSWKEGTQEGSGRYEWHTGNTYIGNWKAGNMCGRGVMKWKNGDVFDGFWLEGMKHGLGFYKFANGGYYLGTWSKGLKDGHGTFFPAGSKLPHLANWSDSNGDYNGKSVLRHSMSTNSGKFRVSSLSFKRSMLERWPTFGFFRSFGRISHRAISLDHKLSLGNSTREVPMPDSSKALSNNSIKDLEEQASSIVVYEREYMQGILVSERIRSNPHGLPSKNKRQQKCQDKKAKMPGEAINKGHKSYYLMLSLQLGIRYTVGKITPVPMREVRSSDFGPQARIRMYFPRQGSQFTPPHYSIDFFWKDYCPMVFRNLREMFKIDAADYMMSICGDDGLRELSSPGKSGSIFYLSQDDRFVIKTLRKSEVKILLKMLPNYYNHVGTHENTLITKFFGLHRITLRGARKVRFVVMGNMFCTELRIHRRYDLKGSSQGRYTEKSQIDQNTTLKDLDLSYEFHLEKSWRDSLFKQITVDCMFLESQCIIDYSLLLGLHFRAPEHLRVLVESQDMLQNRTSSSASDDVCLQGEMLVPSKGLLLVTHEPSSVSTMPGSHIRGSTLRAPAVGDEEVDLLLPDTGRYLNLPFPTSSKESKLKLTGTRKLYDTPRLETWPHLRYYFLLLNDHHCFDLTHLSKIVSRLRVQLGVNMPAQANQKVPLHEADSAVVELVEVYDVVLYLGIIDILQDYNITKKIEHAYKSLRFDPLTISAVEPKLYSKRFINFLEKVFPEQT